MKRSKMAIGVALATIVVMTGCSGNAQESTVSSEDSVPVIIGVGDADNDNNNEVIGAEESNGTAEETLDGPIIYDYGAEDTGNTGSEESVSTSSINGYWADENGNSATFYKDNSAVLGLDDGNTYYAGKVETDNKSYIKMQVYDGVENGESLIVDSVEVDDTDEDDEVEIDTSKIPGYNDSLSEEEKIKIIDDWFKEQDSNKESGITSEEQSDVIKEINITIVNFNETEQGVTLTLKIPGHEQISIVGYCAVSADESYF